MGLPYRARVDERWYLDLPGVSDNEAYVLAYVENTSECGLRSDPSCDETCSCCPENFEPRVVFELGNRRNRFRMPLWVEEPWRRQSLHAVDTLIAALQAMRSAILAECDEYDRRKRLLEEERNISG
jgi:hypothetical protein